MYLWLQSIVALPVSLSPERRRLCPTLNGSRAFCSRNGSVWTRLTWKCPAYIPVIHTHSRLPLYWLGNLKLQMKPALSEWQLHVVSVFQEWYCCSVAFCALCSTWCCVATTTSNGGQGRLIWHLVTTFGDCKMNARLIFSPLYLPFAEKSTPRLYPRGW